MDDDITDSRRINWTEAAVYAAGAGITLIEPRKLAGWHRDAYWAAASLLTGAGAVAAARDDEFGPQPGAGMFAAVSGVAFGLKEPMLKADAWLVDHIASWGVKYPRLLLAGLTLGIGAVSVVLGARRPSWTDEYSDLLEPRDIEPRVRQVVAEMLARTDEWGAPELREQFAAARQLGPFEHGYVEFEVPDDAPELPVDTFTFPVHGRGALGDGSLTVSLHVERGRLAALTVEPDGDVNELGLPDDLEYSVGQPG